MESQYYYNSSRGYYVQGQSITLRTEDGGLFSGVNPSDELLRLNGYEPAELPEAPEEEDATLMDN